MHFIKEQTQIILEIKRSKFITYITPYTEFSDLMKQLKEQHTKARHFVYAYRYLNQFDQIVENSSDDGEPKGTSGRPSLNVLSGGGIINSAVIIVRYFGGVKLGTGGLVKAYSDAVNLVLDEVELYPYLKLETKTLTVSYSNLSKVEYEILQSKLIIKEKIFDNDVKIILEGSKEQFDYFQLNLIRDCVLADGK